MDREIKNLNSFKYKGTVRPLKNSHRAVGAQKLRSWIKTTCRGDPRGEMGPRGETGRRRDKKFPSIFAPDREVKLGRKS